MAVKYIDINADLGEGIGKDAIIMPLVSSCSIACGGHFGNETTMRSAVALANEHRVKVGAHPSFPDSDNFGRKLITLTKSELSKSILDQLLRFYAICEEQDVAVHHVKLHGALYNYACIDAPTADAVVDAIIASKKRPKLYVPNHSILAKKAENLLPLVYEAFIDRKYKDDLSLLSRNDPEAVIKSPEAAWNQLYGMIQNGEVVTVQNTIQPIVASTYCIHGDNEDVVKILQYIRAKLKEHSIDLLK